MQQTGNNNHREDQSIGELLGDLYRGATQVISLEVELVFRHEWFGSYKSSSTISG